MTDRRPGGRPPLPPEERRSSVLRVRLTADEMARVQAVAEARGVSVVELVRGWVGRLR